MYIVVPGCQKKGENKFYKCHFLNTHSLYFHQKNKTHYDYFQNRRCFSTFSIKWELHTSQLDLVTPFQKGLVNLDRMKTIVLLFFFSKTLYVVSWIEWTSLYTNVSWVMEFLTKFYKISLNLSKKIKNELQGNCWILWSLQKLGIILEHKVPPNIK